MPEPENFERRRATDAALDNLRRETNYRFDAIGQRFAAQEQAVQTALAAAKEAVVLANLANEKRFDSLATKMDEVTKYIERLAGKSAGVSVTVGYMIAGATLIISLVVFFVSNAKTG